MSYLFASSHLPENRVRRPANEEEEDDENLQPELRSGTVRAFSHLPQPQGHLADPGGASSPRRGNAPLPPRSSTLTSSPPSTPADQDHPPPPEANHDDEPETDNSPRAPEDDSPWYMPRLSPRDLAPQPPDEDGPDSGLNRPAPKASENPARSPGFDETPPAERSGTSPGASGSAPSPQDLRDAFHSPAPDSPTREAPAQDSRPALTRGRIFEKRAAPESFLRQQLGKDASGSSSQQRLQGSHQVLAAQQQARGANPPAPGGTPAAQPQALAQAQRPAAAPAQAAPAAPQPPAGGGGENQAGQHPYKIHESDENAEIVRTTDASAPPPRKGAKFGEHARSVINAALDNSPTARAALDKACQLSGKNVVIHTTTDTNAKPQIGLDGTIHIYVNPNTLLPGTLTHEIAHAIQHWHLHAAEKAKRGTGQKLEGKELDAAKLRGRQELHGIAPVTYVDPNSNPEDDTSDNEPRSKSTEHEAMRLANIANAEISAAKVKAKMEAFKKARPEDFEKMSKDPEEMAKFVAQSFWFEQHKIEAISHQAHNDKNNKSVPMRESTLYGKDGGLQHVLEMLGYGVTAGHIKNAAPLRKGYAPPTPPR